MRAGTGRFTTAVFQAALDADAAVRPVRITYRAPDGEPSGAPAFVGDDTITASLWRVVTAGGLTAEITVLPLIPAGRHTDRRELARDARSGIARTGTDGVARTEVTDGVTHTAVASDSANRPSSSVHQCVNSIPASASSLRTRS